MENDANKKWLVMVYMAADTGDSFYQAAMEDIAEMMEAEFNPNQVRVMVHADAPSPWPKKCWEIKRPSESWACNHNSLLDFIGDCVKKYPANNYLLVLWGHGEGIDWKEKVIKGSGANSGIIRAGKRFAPGSQGALEVVELGDVLGKLAEELKGKGYAKTFKKENTIVGFDACLMGMAEVYCQISDYVGWVVSPSDEIPNTGWAYKDILNELGISPGKEPPGLAKVIVNRCTESYSGKTSKSDVSFSACTLELSGESRT